MIEKLLKFSLRHRVVVLLLAALLMIAGVWQTQNMPVDVFPDLSAPRVTVVTESTGMAAEDVERLITIPLESAINGTGGLRRVRSASAPGISVVWAEFGWSVDDNLARQRVLERLQTVTATLPAEAGEPLLAPATSVMGEIAFVAVTSDELSALRLRRIAEVRVRRRLLAVQGVSQVVPIGGEVKQYQVLLDPQRLEAYDLSLEEIIEAVERGNQNASGGYVVDGGQEAVVRVLGRSHAASDLGRIVVAFRDGVPILVNQIADVKEGPAVARGTASFNAQSAVLLSVVKQPDADTLSTTRDVDVALAELQKALGDEGVVIHPQVFRQDDFIHRAIDNLVDVLRDGAILVIIVLFIFLWSFRPTLISVLAIPLSLLTSVLVLEFFGLTIDTMTLGGLAIAIGELVDDAIVDVENVVRRLRERTLLEPDARPSVVSVVFAASLEIRSAIVSATAILMLVFAPLLMLGGLEGRLLRPLAIAYLVAIFSSLLIAVTVTPVLCSLLLGDEQGEGNKESYVVRRIQSAYAPVLDWALRKPKGVIGIALALVCAGLLALTSFGKAFLPTFNEGNVTINMVLAPGTSLEQSNALATMAERALLADPGVISVGRRTGRAERDEHVLGVETTELEVRVEVDDPRTREELFSDIRERLKVVPASFSLGQPISHRIEHMVSGQRSAISIKVFGEDLHQLRRVAEEVKAAMANVPGIVDLNVEQTVNIPQLVVDINAEAASTYGLSSGEAARHVGAALWGVEAGGIYEEGLRTPVMVRYPQSFAEDIDRVGRVRVPTPSGALIPISSLAEIRRESGPNYILRENVSRRVVVTANVAGGDVGGVFESARRAIEAKVEMPPGVDIRYAGQFEQAERTQNRLWLFGSLAFFCIALIVTGTLRSARRAAIVLVNLPLALVGGVFGVYAAGGVLSVATTIGFIALFGIAARNGILLATRTRDLELSGESREAAVRTSAHERLVPILMTAVTAALGLLPLALALGQPGSEIQAPMAWVILCGLVTSTVLNMVVVPALLLSVGGVTEPPAKPMLPSYRPPEPEQTLP